MRDFKRFFNLVTARKCFHANHQTTIKMSFEKLVTLSPKEVGLRIGLCSKTVLKLINSGDITPVYRMNKRVIRIPQFAVDAYLRACEAGAQNNQN